MNCASPSAGGQAALDRYWSWRAPDYDARQLAKQAAPGVEDLWREIWSVALPAAPSRILDMGTGSGNVAWLLAGMGHNVTGLDSSPGMLEMARAKQNGSTSGPRFLQGDAVQPELAPGSFDAITARYFLWTLRDPVAALRRWRQLLHPGGVLVVVDALWYPQGVAAEHDTDGSPLDRELRRAYDGVLGELPVAEATTIDQYAGLLEAAGFRDTRVEALPGLLELDERLGVPPGHTPRMQYRITARVDVTVFG